MPLNSKGIKYPCKWGSPKHNQRSRGEWVRSQVGGCPYPLGPHHGWGCPPAARNCISPWKGQKYLRIDGQQPAAHEELACISRGMTEVPSLRWLPEAPSGLTLQLLTVASGLITNPVLAAFPSLPHLTLETKLSPAEISLLVKITSKKSCSSEFPLILQAKICCTPASEEQFHLISDRGQHFVFYRRGVYSWSLQMTPAQNKEKQIEMRILITAKGMKGCVSVSMVRAVFQGFSIPAVKTRFMLGFGKSQASVTENLYIIKDFTFNQVGNVTP